mgnify:CR=1 FL=1
MGMTMTQKILAAHAGLDSVVPGQLIEANIDLALANDITGPVAIRELKKADMDKAFDRTKVALVMDHFAPNKDIKSAEQCKECRDFARKHDIVNFFDVGRMGVEHALLPEQGIVASGDVIIGADSHTCTYGALGAFSTGVGSTDCAAGIATGKAWFRVPSAIKFNLTGKLNPWVSGKDVILYIIGMIGVDGALYQAMEFAGSAIAKSKPMKTAVTASRLGIAAYIVPFVFAFCPALIMQVPVEPYMVVLNTAMALFGLFGVASGLQGYLFGKINPILRVFAIVAGVAIMIPMSEADGIASLGINAIGFLFVFGVFAYQKLVHGKKDKGTKATA